MKTTHPMVGVWENTTIPEALASLVATLPELPTVAQAERLEWDKTGEKAPAGTYTNPADTSVDAHVSTVLASGKYTRRVLTVAMNFRTTKDFDIVRKRLGVKRPVATPVVEPEAPKAEAPKGSRPAKRQAKAAA